MAQLKGHDLFELWQQATRLHSHEPSPQGGPKPAVDLLPVPTQRLQAGRRAPAQLPALPLAQDGLKVLPSPLEHTLPPSIRGGLIDSCLLFRLMADIV